MYMLLLTEREVHTRTYLFEVHAIQGIWNKNLFEVKRFRVIDGHPRRICFPPKQLTGIFTVCFFFFSYFLIVLITF